MSHTATFGAYGVESNVYDNVVHSRKQIHKLMRKYYKNFLTEEELDLMLQGKEFWMDAEEIIERLNILWYLWWYDMDVSIEHGEVLSSKYIPVTL